METKNVDIRGTGSNCTITIDEYGGVRLDLSIEDDCCAAGFAFVAADSFDFYQAMLDALAFLRGAWTIMYGEDFSFEKMKVLKENQEKESFAALRGFVKERSNENGDPTTR